MYVLPSVMSQIFSIDRKHFARMQKFKIYRYQVCMPKYMQCEWEARDDNLKGRTSRSNEVCLHVEIRDSKIVIVSIGYNDTPNVQPLCAVKIKNLQCFAI